MVTVTVYYDTRICKQLCLSPFLEYEAQEGVSEVLFSSGSEIRFRDEHSRQAWSEISFATLVRSHDGNAFNISHESYVQGKDIKLARE